MSEQEQFKIIHEYLSDWYGMETNESVRCALKAELDMIEKMIEGDG